MDFQGLIGKVFSEEEFYELLLFEVEENREMYLTSHLHFYFLRLATDQLMVTEIIYFKDSANLDKQSKSIIEDKEWVEINENHGHIDLMLVRFDRSGKGSIVYEDHTHTQRIWVSWLDEYPKQPPLTKEQAR